MVVVASGMMRGWLERAVAAIFFIYRYRRFVFYSVAAWAYYTLAKKFLYNSLLTLTAGRFER